MAVENLQTVETFALGLVLTNKAVRQLCNAFGAQTGEGSEREHACAILSELLPPGQEIYCYLRNLGLTTHGDRATGIVVATDSTNDYNNRLVKALKGRTLFFIGIAEEEDGFVVIGCGLKPYGAGRQIHASIPVNIRFYQSDSTSYFEETSMPADLRKRVGALEVTRDRDLVENRLQDWRRYLEICGNIARAKQFQLVYNGVHQGRKRSFVTFQLDGRFKDRIPWDKVDKARQQPLYARPLEVSEAMHGESADVPLGALESVSRSNLTVGVRLDAKLLAEKVDITRLIETEGLLIYKAIGDIKEIERQQEGLERLKWGEACNPNLQEFLFDVNGARQIEERMILGPEDQLLTNLNEGQKEAVEGALSCPDIYLIKGPPGTGKTTVIAEMCYQMARRGKRTLIASQSNLAVDNALSRLVHDPSIRALRVGRTAGIEEEGLPFVESRVVGTWMEQTATLCEQRLSHLEKANKKMQLLSELAMRLTELGKRLCPLEEAEKDFLSSLEVNRHSLGQLRKKLSAIEEKIKRLTDRVAVCRQLVEVRGANNISLESAASEEVLKAISGLKEYADFRESIEWVQSLLQKVLTSGELSIRLMGKWSPNPMTDRKAAITLRNTATEFVRQYDRLRPWLKSIDDILNDLARVQQELAALRTSMQSVQDDIDQNRQQKEKLIREQDEIRNHIGIIKCLPDDFPGGHENLVHWSRQFLQNAYKAYRQGTRFGHFMDPRSNQAEVGKPNLAVSLPKKLYDAIWRVCWEDAPPAFGRCLKKAAQAASSDFTLELAREARSESIKAVKELNGLLGEAGDYIDQPVREELKEKGKALFQLATSKGGEWVVDRSIVTQLREVVDYYKSGDSMSNLANRIRGIFDPAGAQKTVDERRRAGRQVLYRFHNRMNVICNKVLAKAEQDREALEEGIYELATSLHASLRQSKDKVIQNLRGEEETIGQRLIKVTEDLLELKKQKNELAQMQASEKEKEGSLLGQLQRQREEWNSVHEELNFASLRQLTAFDRLPGEENLSEVSVWQQRYRQVNDVVAMLEQENPWQLFTTLVNKVESGLRGQLAAHRDEKEQLVRKACEVEETIADFEARVKETREQIAKEMPDWREVLEVLQELELPNTPDRLEVHNLADLEDLESLIEKNKEQLIEAPKQLERWGQLTREWVKHLRSGDAKDQADLRRLYIANANVIGTTCSRSGAKDFRREYGRFDLVIVDEVSKATPPELLLPLLLGKRIVLVGDDKQLPPMVGSETLRELAEELGSSEQDLDHLKRSLFAELWRNAPEGLKTMLNIQYRMHPTIMQVINQFYDWELQCGLSDPDIERAHGCAGRLVDDTVHAVWVDMPMAKQFQEESVGTSYRNMSEIEAIEAILTELDTCWQEKVANGAGKKEVGVITFYAAQSRALEDRLLDDPEKYSNLELRIGSVDRFQGMERPIIIVSMVRNNQQGRIGFAREPERINVALSRAQELLILVGCAQLFCSKAKASSATESYSQVAGVMRREGRLTNVWRILNDW